MWFIHWNKVIFISKNDLFLEFLFPQNFIMIKLKIRKNFILDILFILTYSIGYASLLKYVTYVIFPLPESIQLFLFLFFLYLFRFGGKYRNVRRISSNVSYFLFFLYFWEIFQGMIVGAESNSLLVAAVNLSSTDTWAT